jgi:hypothetical protein
LARRVEHVDWAAKRKLAKKNKTEMRKHISGVAVHHFLPDPPNKTSRRVPEVTMRKGSQWQMRKHERLHDSEVAIKKTLMKHG